MPFFKKTKKTDKPEKKLAKKSSSPKINKKNKTEEKKVIVKKRTRIGFRRKKDENVKEPDVKQIQEIENEKINHFENDDIFEEKEIPAEEPEEKKPFSTKKKTLMKKDLKGKPVFLEDTGEKLGAVFDSIYDKDNKLVGYKIKDDKSDAVLSFPLDQFDESKDGLIFVPGWYTNSIKIIEKLEFKDRVSPDLTALLSDDSVSNEELYEIFVKHDDEMAHYIEDAISLKEMLHNRLKILEKQRFALKEDLMNLTEKRLIKDIDRKEFSEEITALRHKVNILDVNIDKCKNLIKRLDNTSFGFLGKNNLMKELDFKEQKQDNKQIYENFLEEPKEKNQIYQEKKQEDYYKERYYTLKEQYKQLEDDYQELKIAVDKLFNKNE